MLWIGTLYEAADQCAQLKIAACCSGIAVHDVNIMFLAVKTATVAWAIYECPEKTIDDLGRAT